MEPQESYIQYHAEKLTATSEIAIQIAQEKNKAAREMEIEEYRKEQLALAEARVIPARVTCQKQIYGTVPCEWVSLRINPEEEGIILYLHGGSWMYGGLESGRPVGVMLTTETRFPCLMVDYRLAPEHPFPAGFDDCYSVYIQLLEEGYRPEKIGIFGDSAGGNLTLALLHRLKSEGRPLPCCIGLASPATDMQETSEFVSSGDDLLYTQYQGKEVSLFDLYLGEEYKEMKGLPSISPINGDLEGLPPILIHAGGAEPIAGDNLRYVKKVQAAGGSAVLKVWQDMFHDFTIVGKTLRESRQSMKEMGEFFRKHMMEEE